MYEDSETEDERLFYKTILLSVFGDPRHIKWLDNEDPPSPETHLSRSDAAATDKIRGVFDSIMKREAPNAAS